SALTPGTTSASLYPWCGARGDTGVSLGLPAIEPPGFGLAQEYSPFVAVEGEHSDGGRLAVPDADESPHAEVHLDAVASVGAAERGRLPRAGGEGFGDRGRIVVL